MPEHDSHRLARHVRALVDVSLRDPLVVDNAEEPRCLPTRRRADVRDRGGDPTSVEIAYVIERGLEDPNPTGHSSMMPDRERAVKRGHCVGG